MDQTYLEILVARERNMAAAVLKIVSGIFAVFSLVMIPFSVFFILAAAACGALAYYCYLQEWVEYEYSYVSRELTVDKIMARSRRKTIENYMVDKIEIGAPEGSYHLDGYNRKKWDVRDYSSKNGKKTFVFYYEGRRKVILEADEGLQQALRAAAPSKIFLN